MTEAASRPTRTKATGAWADGDRTPLNPNEEFKAADDGLNVRRRIEEVYSKEGFSAIEPNDLHGRMRWWGLYTQRKQGLDGTHTGEDNLDDEYFMMRVRSDGGMLTLEQLRTIGQISTEFARETADISDRQNIQLHWIDVRDVPTIWQRLEAVGLSTTEACGDCPRVLLGSPVAGVDAREIVDGTPAIERIKEAFIGDPSLSNLPRKFKTAISGSPTLDVAHEINDVSFVGVNHPEHGPGFDVWVGGGLSTNPMFAQRLGAWVPLEQVPDVWLGVVSIFRDYGYRRLRNRARLKFLVNDWGAEKFRQILEDEYLGKKLIDGPEATGIPGVKGDHIGVHEQKDGKVWVGLAPTVGRVTGSKLTQLADLAEAAGSGRVRLTAQQKVLVLDVDPDQAEELVEKAAALGLNARPSQFRRGTMACTGIEFCKLALVDTKNRASELVDTLEQRLPDLDVPFAIHVNGCPNACARTQVADIGLKGMIVRNEDDSISEVFQVHLGGQLGIEPALARKTRALKVPGEELPEYVERVVGNYLAGRTQGEGFAAWAHRADEEELR